MKGVVGFVPLMAIWPLERGVGRGRAKGVGGIEPHTRFGLIALDTPGLKDGFRPSLYVVMTLCVHTGPYLASETV